MAIAKRNAEVEVGLRSLHLVEPALAAPTEIADPEPPNPGEVRPSLEAQYGVTALLQALAAFGDPPQPPEPQRPDTKEIARSFYREMIREIPAWRRTQRKAARESAASAAEAAADAAYEQQRDYREQVAAWITARQGELAEQRSAVEARLCEWVEAEKRKRRQRVDAQRRQAQKEWDLLEHNDPTMTTLRVEEALNKAGIPAAVHAIKGTTTTVVVVCGMLDDWVAQNGLATTAAGRPTTKKRSKTQRNELYLAAIASAVLSAVHVTLATAPGTSSVTCIAARCVTPDENRAGRYVPIYMGTFTREMLDEFRALEVWTSDPRDLQDMLRAADEVSLVEKGRAKDIQPLDDDSPSAQATQTAEATAQGSTKEDSPQDQAEQPEEQTVGLRLMVCQENALGPAQDYLRFSSFSRRRLIEQLRYEGYSTRDATFAVDHVEVDWNEQAAKSARGYLESSDFSRSGLIEQLKWEGFTSEQAAYGVDSAGL